MDMSNDCEFDSDAEIESIVRSSKNVIDYDDSYVCPDTFTNSFDFEQQNLSEFDQENVNFYPSPTKQSSPLNAPKRMPLSNQSSTFNSVRNQTFATSSFNASQLTVHSQRTPLTTKSYNLIQQTPTSSSFNKISNPVAFSSFSTLNISKKASKRKSQDTIDETPSKRRLYERDYHKSIQKLVDHMDPSVQYFANTDIGTSSDVWSHFQLVQVNGIVQPFSKCNKCDKLYSYDPKRIVTTSMRRQCEKRKDDLLSTRQRVNQANQPQPPLGRLPVELPHYVKEHMKNLQVMVCARGLISLGVWDNAALIKAFQFAMDIAVENHHLGKISAKDVLFSGKTVGRQVEKVYGVIKDKMVKEFEQAEDVAITADHWTEKFTNKSFLGLNASYLVDGQLKCRQLVCRSVTNKVCEDTAIETDKVLSEFGIGLDKLSGYVTDQALQSAFDYQSKPKDQKEPHPWTHPDIDYKRCDRHQMNLVGANLFKPENGPRIAQICDQLDSCKKLVKMVKKSGTQSQMKPTLKQEVPTRWDSKKRMIDSILANFSVLTEIESTQTIENLVQSLDEEMLTELKKYLDIWEYMGKYISCQTKPTLCRVWPARHALKNRSFQYLSTSKLQPLRAKFMQLFDDKFTYKPLHKLATFLWPRYRNSKELFTQIDFIIIKREAHRLNNKIKNRLNRNKPILELPKVPEVFDEVLGQYSFEKLTLDQEITKYRDYLSPVELSLPIFEFWDKVSHRFPLLSAIARRVHIIPATEVSTERRFNISGQTMSKRRVHLKERLTDQLTTINDSHDLYDDDALVQAFQDVFNIVDDDANNADTFDE